MKIIKVPIEKCELWEKNPRGITKKDFERLKKQIQKLGVYKPLIACQENGKYIILGGNMRLRALQELGYKDVELSIVEAKTEKEKIEYSLSDNDRVGYYEEEKLAELIYPHLDELELEDYKIDIGEAISLKDVVEDFGPDIDDEKADEAPEIDDAPAITRPGDLYQLGKHRLLCGDSTSADDVARVMGPEKAGAMFTDPPYGIDMAPCSITRKLPKLKNDNLKNDSFIKFLSSFLSIARPVVDGEAFICCDWRRYTDFKFAMDASGFPVTCLIVWNKETRAQNLNRFAFVHEFICYSGPMGPPTLDVNVWTLPRIYSDNHLTPKPVALVERAIKTTQGIIFDPFLGTGTTIIAAEKLGRICYGIEIEPKYCDVIIKRFSEYIGIPEEEIRKTRQAAK